MRSDGFRGPKLPKSLLDQVDGGNGSDKRRARKFSHQPRDRDRRPQKVQNQRVSQSAPPRRAHAATDRRPAAHQSRDDDLSDDVNEGLDDAFGFSPSPQPESHREAGPVVPPKSILKKSSTPTTVGLSDDSTEHASDDATSSEKESSHPIVSRGTKRQLEEDDAQIAALEKKLGVKKKKRSKGHDDFDFLLGGSDSEEESAPRSTKSNRNAEDDEWLRRKRHQASKPIVAVSAGSDDEVESDDLDVELDDVDDEDSDTDEQGDIANPFSDDELDSDDLDGFDSDVDDTAPKKPKKRENPYVAPVSGVEAAGKYIPPSMRKPMAADEEALHQLRRQLKGQLNRLSEANLLSILSAIEDIYAKNPRQYVTQVLVELLVGLASDPSILNEPFVILHAGFASAVYKVSGTDFGAQLLESIVESLDKHMATSAGKQTLNLIGFMSCLYLFQAIGSAVVFDYVQILLAELSESNTELLLRVIRNAGQQLRQDDPSALKDIVLLLQKSVAKTGEANLSVRTKFMIDTINDLKNNRVKTGAAASTVASEHTAAMKKTLSSLNTRAKVREPLRVSLADIRDSEKKGRWWLVGASYHDPAKMVTSTSNSTNKPSSSTLAAEDAGYESETPGHVNLHKLARQQGMNTEIRRSIFITILSSADYIDASHRLTKLHLKPKQQLEIPRVLLHCVRSEAAHNPFYALIARKFCGGTHALKKALQFGLWDDLKRIQASDGDEEGLDDGDEQTPLTRAQMLNLASFYAVLLSASVLPLSALLKPLPPFSHLKGSTATMMLVLLTNVFVRSRKAEGGLEEAVKGLVRMVGGRAQGVDAARVEGLRVFLETTVAKAELARGKKEVDAVKKGCTLASEALSEVMRAGLLGVDGGESEDEGSIDESDSW